MKLKRQPTSTRALEVKEVAAASMNRHPKRYPSPTCHHWLATGRCSNKPTCNYTHTPEHKGRSGLLPYCPNLDEQGNCTRANCIFRHLPAATTPTAPAHALVAGATPQQQQTSEVAELKTLLLSLMKDGAEQKALITALLTEED